MGDACNQADLDRFMRSREGKEYMTGIVEFLKGRRIVGVVFTNEVHQITTTLLLDDGETFEVFQPSLEVDVIREEFSEVIQREYYIDYPERRPGARKPAEQRAVETKHSSLIPVTKWNEFHDWPPIGGLRHLVFHAGTNGFDKVIRKVGGRVLIDEDAFFEWTKSGKSTMTPQPAPPAIFTKPTRRRKR